MWRVMWQHGPRRMGSMRSERAPDTAELMLRGKALWSGIAIAGEAEPIFRAHAATLRSMLPARLATAADPRLDLAGYFHAFVKTADDAASLVSRLKEDPDIIYADAQQRWQHPVRFGRSDRAPILRQALSVPLPTTPNLVPEQAYLAAAPGGVDALHAWTRPGGQGVGVKIVDVESGWNFSHEDLRANENGVIFGPSEDDDHGTAVLGICSGDVNPVGVTGISPGAFVGAASADYDFTVRKWNAADAIRAAVARLAPGDIILLEMHAPGPNAHGNDNSQEGFIPVEYWQPEFAAIKLATARGIYVVEAGGNGGENLDAPIYGGAFSRQQRDSGAILVGAGHSAFNAHPRSRISWSNFGSRVDVQGWGLDIVTTGGRSRSDYFDRVDDPDPSRCYSQSFGGTSGASPIIVGVIACISGCLRAANRPPLTPAQMSTLLKETGTPQTSAPDFPASQNIGPLPNLRAALSQLNL